MVQVAENYFADW